MACSPPGSVHWIPQARILEWAALFSFLTQGRSLCLLHLLQWQAGSLPLSHRGRPLNRTVVTKSHSAARSIHPQGPARAPWFGEMCVLCGPRVCRSGGWGAFSLPIPVISRPSVVGISRCCGRSAPSPRLARAGTQGCASSAPGQDAWSRGLHGTRSHPGCLGLGVTDQLRVGAHGCSVGLS